MFPHMSTIFVCVFLSGIFGKIIILNRERTLCPGSYVTITCEPGLINMKEVFYGRDSAYICPRGGRTGYCTSENTTNVVLSLCDSRPYCVIHVSLKSMNGQKCKYVNPYLRIRYDCYIPEMAQRTTESNSTVLSEDESTMTMLIGPDAASTLTDDPSTIRYFVNTTVQDGTKMPLIIKFIVGSTCFVSLCMTGVAIWLLIRNKKSSVASTVKDEKNFDDSDYFYQNWK